MAQCAIRKAAESLLSLENKEEALYKNNHILEPEYHQDIYVNVCNNLQKKPNAFQLTNCKELVGEIHRGIQPKYADDDTDSSTLYWKGMLDETGNIISDPQANVCALKSISIRSGYIDFETARSVSRDFYETNKNRAGIIKNDVLINSTGDGTIGRVAVYDQDFPAIVDGHITILRFNDVNLAWFIAAFLLSDKGQKQIKRYINGSSGQVEIYSQDIGRIWVALPDNKTITTISQRFMNACKAYNKFKFDLKNSLTAI
jgi:type I restriction enzyme M protein